MARILAFFLVVFLCVGHSVAQEDSAAPKKDVVQDKLYTGGFGANIYLISAGYALGFSNFYRNDIYEPDEDSYFNFEIYLQYGRFATLFETANEGVAGVRTWGFGFGYVLYDSRYLKVRPYARVGWSNMNVETRKDYISTYVYQYDGSIDYTYHDAGKTHSGSSDGSPNSYTLAVDVDFRVASLTIFKVGDELVSFDVTAKAALTYMDIDDEYGKGSGVASSVSIGLGMYFW